MNTININHICAYGKLNDLIKLQKKIFLNIIGVQLNINAFVY
jgi:hypothetical protein